MGSRNFEKCCSSITSDNAEKCCYDSTTVAANKEICCGNSSVSSKYPSECSTTPPPDDNNDDCNPAARIKLVFCTSGSSCWDPNEGYYISIAGVNGTTGAIDKDTIGNMKDYTVSFSHGQYSYIVGSGSATSTGFLRKSDLMNMNCHVKYKGKTVYIGSCAGNSNIVCKHNTTKEVLPASTFEEGSKYIDHSGNRFNCESNITTCSYEIKEKLKDYTCTGDFTVNECGSNGTCSLIENGNIAIEEFLKDKDDGYQSFEEMDYEACCYKQKETNGTLIPQCCILPEFKDSDERVIKDPDGVYGTEGDFVSCCAARFFMTDAINALSDGGHYFDAKYQPLAYGNSEAFYKNVKYRTVDYSKADPSTVDFVDNLKNREYMFSREPNDFANKNIDGCCANPDLLSYHFPYNSDETWRETTWKEHCCTSDAQYNDGTGCCEHMIANYMIRGRTEPAIKCKTCSEYDEHGRCLYCSEAYSSAELLVNAYKAYPGCKASEEPELEACKNVVAGKASEEDKLTCCKAVKDGKKYYNHDTKKNEPLADILGGDSNSEAWGKTCCLLIDPDPKYNDQYYFRPWQTKECCPYYLDANTGLYYYEPNSTKGYKPDDPNPYNYCYSPNGNPCYNLHWDSIYKTNVDDFIKCCEDKDNRYWKDGNVDGGTPPDWHAKCCKTFIHDGEQWKYNYLDDKACCPYYDSEINGPGNSSASFYEEYRTIYYGPYKKNITPVPSAKLYENNPENVCYKPYDKSECDENALLKFVNNPKSLKLLKDLTPLDYKQCRNLRASGLISGNCYADSIDDGAYYAGVCTTADILLHPDRIPKDYYAAAVQYCDGESHLASYSDIQNLRNCTFRSPKGNFVGGYPSCFYSNGTDHCTGRLDLVYNPSPNAKKILEGKGLNIQDLTVLDFILNEPAIYDRSHQGCQGSSMRDLRYKAMFINKNGGSNNKDFSGYGSSYASGWPNRYENPYDNNVVLCK